MLLCKIYYNNLNDNIINFFKERNIVPNKSNVIAILKILKENSS